MKRDTQAQKWDTKSQMTETKGEISADKVKWRSHEDSNPEPAD